MEPLAWADTDFDIPSVCFEVKIWVPNILQSVLKQYSCIRTDAGQNYCSQPLQKKLKSHFYSSASGLTYINVKKMWMTSPNVKPNWATTPVQNKRIPKVFEQNAGLSMDQGVEKLRRLKISVSKSTLKRWLADGAVRYRPTIKKPLLTALDIEKRVRWANENLTTDWSKAIFTDESSFWRSNPLTHSRCTRENRTVERTIKHPQKVHVYGGFCEAGFGKMTVFTGILR